MIRRLSRDFGSPSATGSGRKAAVVDDLDEEIEVVEVLHGRIVHHIGR